MSDRDKILGRVKTATAGLPQRAAYPDYDRAQGVKLQRDTSASLKDQFAAELIATNGRFLDSWQGVVDLLKAEGCSFGYCDPSLHALLLEQGLGIEVETTFNREAVDRYEFGITRAAGGIAETGTIVLSDATSPFRLASLAPWVHVAVLKPNHLWPTTVEAIAAMGNDPNVVWVTGPSKTADVEGIMIEGVHGPGVQACCLIEC